MEVPLNHPFIDGTFHLQTIHLGVPPFMETPKCAKVAPAKYAKQKRKNAWQKGSISTLSVASVSSGSTIYNHKKYLASRQQQTSRNDQRKTKNHRTLFTYYVNLSWKMMNFDILETPSTEKNARHVPSGNHVGWSNVTEHLVFCLRISCISHESHGSNKDISVSI